MNDLQTAYQHMIEADQIYANRPTTNTLQNLLRTQRAYYTARTHYLRHNMAAHQAKQARAQGLLNRARQNRKMAQANPHPTGTLNTALHQITLHQVRRATTIRNRVDADTYIATHHHEAKV